MSWLLYYVVGVGVAACGAWWVLHRTSTPAPPPPLPDFIWHNGVQPHRSSMQTYWASEAGRHTSAIQSLKQSAVKTQAEQVRLLGLLAELERGIRYHEDSLALTTEAPTPQIEIDIRFPEVTDPD